MPLWIALLVFLAACNQIPTNPNNPGPGPLPNTGTFALGYAPSNFKVTKGSQAELTVTVQINQPSVSKVRLNFVQGTAGVTASPTEQTLSGNGSLNFTVRLASNVSDAKPFFYIYGQGLSSNDSTNGQELRSIKVQWDQ